MIESSSESDDEDLMPAMKMEQKRVKKLALSLRVPFETAKQIDEITHKRGIKNSALEVESDDEIIMLN